MNRPGIQTNSPAALHRYNFLREPAIDGLAGQYWLTGHGSTHAVGVHLLIERLHRGLLHKRAVKALLLGDRAVFVREEESLQVDNFFPQLRNLRRQCIVLAAEDLDLRLKISEPLLLSLAAFQRSHPGKG